MDRRDHAIGIHRNPRGGNVLQTVARVLGRGEMEGEEIPAEADGGHLPGESSQDSEEAPGQSKPSLDRAEILRALEVVERDSTAIAESYASLFSSLRLALSEVTSTSVEHMRCFNDVVGHLQESALDAATKGNRYINSCLRLNEEMKGMESLAMQLKILRRNVDVLDSTVNGLLRLQCPWAIQTGIY